MQKKVDSINHAITHNKLSNSCQFYGSLLSLMLRIYVLRLVIIYLRPPSLQSITLSPFVVPQTKQFESVLAFKEFAV